MIQDVRDKSFLNPDDITRLNFIRPKVPYVFRRHYRQGLRSHIMEVLDPGDVALEKNGVVSEGIKWFPRAKPRKMLRIFRTRFDSLQAARDELHRVIIVASFLGPESYARSTEFLISYNCGKRRDILLCGLQEYVEGLNIEPWGYLNADRLTANLLRPRLGGRPSGEMDRDALVKRIRISAAAFIHRVKRMILESGYVPDLAGDGNLILTDSGDIKLVDINNISPVSFGKHIYVDDKKYPVCDKSIEALSELERNLAGRSIDMSEPVYRTFLDPIRKIDVSAIEKEFHRASGVQQPYRPD